MRSLLCRPRKALPKAGKCQKCSHHMASSDGRNGAIVITASLVRVSAMIRTSSTKTQNLVLISEISRRLCRSRERSRRWCRSAGKCPNLGRNGFRAAGKLRKIQQRRNVPSKPSRKQFRQPQPSSFLIIDPAFVALQFESQLAFVGVINS